MKQLPLSNMFFILFWFFCSHHYHPLLDFRNKRASTLASDLKLMRPSSDTVCDTHTHTYIHILFKDTVSTDKEDNEVDADENTRHARSSVSHDAIVHDSVPVLTRQDLHFEQNFDIFFLNTSFQLCFTIYSDIFYFCPHSSTDHLDNLMTLKIHVSDIFKTSF